MRSTKEGVKQKQDEIGCVRGKGQGVIRFVDVILKFLTTDKILVTNKACLSVQQFPPYMIILT